MHTYTCMQQHTAAHAYTLAKNWCKADFLLGGSYHLPYNYIHNWRVPWEQVAYNISCPNQYLSWTCMVGTIHSSCCTQLLSTSLAIKPWLCHNFTTTSDHNRRFTILHLDVMLHSMERDQQRKTKQKTVSLNMHNPSRWRIKCKWCQIADFEHNIF